MICRMYRGVTNAAKRVCFMQLVLLKVLPGHAIRLAMVPPCSSQKLMKLVKMPNNTNSIHFGTNWVAL